MKSKKLLAHIFIRNQKAVTDLKNHKLLGDGNVLRLAQLYEQNGADGLVIFDLSQSEEEHEANLDTIRQLSRTLSVPLTGGGHIKRAEDVKKLLYAGCSQVFLNMSKQSNVDMLKEVSQRFGREKIGVCINDFVSLPENSAQLEQYASAALLFGDNRHIYEAVNSTGLQSIPLFSEMLNERIGALLKLDKVSGVSIRATEGMEINLSVLRQKMSAMGIPVQSMESALSWSDLTLNSDGLIPVVVQDYKDRRVLMVAYMNEEAFHQTLMTGKMTYYSRSRHCLWVKGETSGHFQFVKEISIDCDNDTLLAQVAQIGAACHTGNRSCFYRDLVPARIHTRSAAMVFEEVMGTILDRKDNPKEGSYTNYLFDKGIDKILKKLGEEATEIVIAAKNPNPEEIKYEICDLLYHMMVLMAEKNISWEEVAEELAKR